MVFSLYLHIFLSLDILWEMIIISYFPFSPIIYHSSRFLFDLLPPLPSKQQHTTRVKSLTIAKSFIKAFYRQGRKQTLLEYADLLPKCRRSNINGNNRDDDKLYLKYSLMAMSFTFILGYNLWILCPKIWFGINIV